MRVILIEDVAHVGQMGEIVKVADGYGRNYLIPKGLAVLATEQKSKEFAHQKALIEHKKAKLTKAAQESLAQITALKLELVRAANEDGKLHGAVTNRDIADAIKAKGIDVDRRKIIVEDIRKLGDFDVEIRLMANVVAKIKVSVVSPKSEA